VKRQIKGFLEKSGFSLVVQLDYTTGGAARSLRLSDCTTKSDKRGLRRVRKILPQVEHSQDKILSITPKLGKVSEERDSEIQFFKVA
jgi:hypothetical protein